MIAKDQYPALKKYLKKEVTQLQENLKNLEEIQQAVENDEDLSVEQFKKLQQYNAQKNTLNIYM